MPEVAWKAQCSEDEGAHEYHNGKLKKEQRPKSAPAPNFDELVEKLKVFTFKWL